MIIKIPKSIIPSCDVSTLEQLRKLVKETCSVEGIGAYKIGFELALRYGIPVVVNTIRKETDLPIIYDHQKAATDIPEMGNKFMDAVDGVNAVILFPVMGPETEKAWIEAGKKAKMPIIVGGEMTHPSFLKKDKGYIDDEAPKKIYELAADLGVRDFVVPGNKPEKIQQYKTLLENKGIKPVFYSPGLVTQGGDVTEGARAAGNNWHAIVGRAIYDAKDMHKAAKEMVSKLV